MNDQPAFQTMHDATLEKEAREAQEAPGAQGSDRNYRPWPVKCKAVLAAMDPNADLRQIAFDADTSVVNLKNWREQLATVTDYIDGLRCAHRADIEMVQRAESEVIRLKAQLSAPVVPKGYEQIATIHANLSPGPERTKVLGLLVEALLEAKN